jgi:rare lipoprotein A
MVNANNLKDALADDLSSALDAVRRTGETLRELPRVMITAEERLRQRIRAALRVVIATTFLGISGLISFGATVTMALAKKADHSTQTREKRSKGHHRARKHRLYSRPDGAMRLSGTASWYGGKFQHRRTASGKTFDTHTMMAAHLTLPFGTKVKVTNMSNHRTCIVEITDRGPYVGNRIIDLSYAAANRLGFASTGTAKVSIEVLPDGEEYTLNYSDPVELMRVGGE